MIVTVKFKLEHTWDEYIDINEEIILEDMLDVGLPPREAFVHVLQENNIRSLKAYDRSKSCIFCQQVANFLR